HPARSRRPARPRPPGAQADSPLRTRRRAVAADRSVTECHNTPHRGFNVTQSRGTVARNDAVIVPTGPSAAAAGAKARNPGRSAPSPQDGQMIPTGNVAHGLI